MGEVLSLWDVRCTACGHRRGDHLSTGSCVIQNKRGKCKCAAFMPPKSKRRKRREALAKRTGGDAA